MNSEGGPGIPPRRAGGCRGDSEENEEPLHWHEIKVPGVPGRLGGMMQVLARWPPLACGIRAIQGFACPAARTPGAEDTYAAALPRSINLDCIRVIGSCSRGESRPSNESREGKEASGTLPVAESDGLDSGFYQSSQTKPQQS